VSGQKTLGRPTWPGSAIGRSLLRRPYSVTSLGPDDAAETAREVVDFADEDPIQRRMRLEAVLLLAKSPLTTRKLAQLAHLADATEARTLVRQLNQIYDDFGRSLKIEQVAGGYRMLTRVSVSPWLTRLGHLPPAVRLSSPMMETLAVVAYRQPVSRANVESVRGVACGELLRQLMERDLIRIAGRSEELGRPYLYGTTKRFLQLFGLPNVEALPPIQWQRLQEDSPTEEFTSEDLSTPTKESVVSTAVASVVADTDPQVPAPVITLESPGVAAAGGATAVIEDEENEIYDDDDLDDDDLDDDDDDWDDEDEDWDDDDDDDDDLEEEDDVDEDEDEWEEVDDGDDDIDDDEDDEFDDDDDDEWDEEDEEWDEEDDEEVVDDEAVVDDEEEDEEWE
jgi:segregation and condensation protein B